MKHYCIKQHDITDCGAACLATVSKQYGLKMPISKIREVAGTDKQGTNAAGMIKAAEKLGFTAKAVKGDQNAFFSEFPLPAIAHVVVDGALLHYVVIHKITQKQVVVADPAKGIVKYTPEEFFKQWTGILILLVPSERFEKGDETESTLSRFFKLLLPQKKLLFDIFLASLVYTILGVGASFYFKVMMDDIVPNGLETTLHVVSVGVILLYLFQTLLGAFRSHMMLYLSQRLDIEVNGKSFIDKEKEYLEIIADTESNEEYYYALSAIFSSIPSAHTRLLIDKTAFTSYTASYNAGNVILPENAPYTAYWDELFMNSITDIDSSDHIEFLYVGGKYIYSPNYSCLGEEYKNSILISVNDIPIDEYITEKTYPSTIRYDANNEKWYRARADFNATNGENAQVKIKKADGTEETLDLYFDIASSAKFLINYSSEKHKDDDTKKKCYSLEINNIAYLKLDSFADSSVFELKEKLPDIPYDMPLIIDIRDNGGGYIDYVTGLLYPLLYSEDYTYKAESFVKISGDLKSVVYPMMSLFDSNTYKLTYKNFNLSGFHYRMKEKINIKGGDAPERDIYILTGRNTVSAADMFAGIAKEQENTLLIGSNTMGEGIFANYYMDILPNSKMVYLFIPSYAENSDGMDNSVYGTSPDIYSELSIENYIIQQELIENGEDPYTYENRLKWDNVLIKTLELIKEDENDKGNNTADE